MAIELEYQPPVNDRRERLSRRISRIGIVLNVAGGIVMLVAAAVNAGYMKSYPAGDVVLFVLEIIAAPAVGLLLLWCGHAMRGDRRGGAISAIWVLAVIGLLGLLVMFVAAVETLESASRGTYVDAVVTFAGGVCVPALVIWYCTSLIPQLRRF